MRVQVSVQVQVRRQEAAVPQHERRQTERQAGLPCRGPGHSRPGPSALLGLRSPVLASAGNTLSDTPRTCDQGPAPRGPVRSTRNRSSPGGCRGTLLIWVTEPKLVNPRLARDASERGCLLSLSVASRDLGRFLPEKTCLKVTMSWKRKIL